MTREIYLAAGCFWGAEHYLKKINGVTMTEVGFANGRTENPTYKEVYTDTTGYAECVRVQYDDARLPLAFLLRLYLRAIDPTSLNRQGEDEGTRYRTGIYYTIRTTSTRTPPATATCHASCLPLLSRPIVYPPTSAMPPTAR